MKKAKLLLTAALMGALLVGCGGGGSGGRAFAPAESSIYIAKDGGILGALVETYEKDRYTQEELKAFVEKEIIAYNQENGAAASAYSEDDAGTKLPAALKECTLKDGKALVVIDYASVKDLIQFSAESGDQSHSIKNLEVAPIDEAVSKGYLAENSFTKPDGSQEKAEAIAKQSGLTVVYVEGKARVQAEGKVLYISEGVTPVDEYTVVTPDEGNGYIIFK